MTHAANVALKVVLRSSSLRVTRKCMRAGLSPKSPALLVDSGGPHGHTKPTQSYPLIVVPVLAFVVVPVLAFVVVAVLGVDRGLSY